MNSISRIIPACLWGIAACQAGVLAADRTSAPGPVEPAPQRGPAVVELFTSEGCSSCPPAETVLGSLAARADVLALAFHVTYWDNGAWRDVFGQADAVIRQGRYVESLGLPSAYTPQAIVNGTRDVLGSNEQGLERAIAQAPRPARLPGTRTGSGWLLSLPDLPTACPCTLRLIGVQADAETRVHGGENAGRTIREYRIVRSTLSLGTWDGRASRRTIALSGLPKDATSVVVLAERRQDASIVAAGEMTL